MFTYSGNEDQARSNDTVRIPADTKTNTDKYFKHDKQRKVRFNIPNTYRLRQI